MSRLRRLLHWKITSDATVVRIVQMACFVTAPALLILSLTSVTRFATTPGEVFLGVLASSTLALLMTIMGLLLPMTLSKPTT